MYDSLSRNTLQHTQLADHKNIKLVKGDVLDFANTGASLLNWNKQHYLAGENPYFLGIRYKYDLQVLSASKAYAKALFRVAKSSTRPTEGQMSPPWPDTERD